LTVNKSRGKFFTSLGFKSWLYFMLFAMSILLLLQIFQIILLEPFYKGTLHKDIMGVAGQISSIYFSDASTDDKNNLLNNLTTQHDACILIYDTTSTTAKAYDALGEGGCAIYSGGNVNPTFIDEMDKTSKDSIYDVGNYLELSTQQVMVYGEKMTVKDKTYYVIVNFALQSMDAVIRTTQWQLAYIMFIVLLLSFVISLLFSRILSRPIVGMTKEAAKMSYGDYDVHFNPSGFNEVDDLSATLTTAAGAMARLDETSKEMIANVSHDIKTPLTMIRAYAEMVRDISGSNKKKRTEHLNIIIQETDHLNSLVTDMLELSRLQAQKSILSVVPFDIGADIDKAVSGFNSLASEQGAIIEVYCEPELVAIGDEAKISEVLYNYISNALKHVGRDKKIIIKAFFKGKNTIRVEVTDHGPGIRQEDIPYIWDRYYKSDKSYQRAQQGTGLGLAICKAVLDEHKCPYGVETQIGKGSTFYFEIPSVQVK